MQVRRNTKKTLLVSQSRNFIRNVSRDQHIDQSAMSIQSLLNTNGVTFLMTSHVRSALWTLCTWSRIKHDQKNWLSLCNFSCDKGVKTGCRKVWIYMRQNIWYRFQFWKYLIIFFIDTPLLHSFNRSFETRKNSINHSQKSLK